MFHFQQINDPDPKQEMFLKCLFNGFEMFFNDSEMVLFFFEKNVYGVEKTVR